MRLVKIDSKDVEENPGNYNSCLHTEAEAPDLPIPSELPRHYSRWLTLISKSQSIPLEPIQTITLAPTQGRLTISVAQSSLHTRERNRVYAEDLGRLRDRIRTLYAHFPGARTILASRSLLGKDGVKEFSR